MSSALIRQQSFAGGEIAPERYGRTSDPKHAHSLRTCKNFLPTVHGALLNRSGTTFVASAKGQAYLRRFVFSDGQALVLEFGNLYVRFIYNGAQVVTGGPPVPYELATPYALADVPRLKLAQAGDVITIAHPSYQPRDLTRVSNTNWTLAVIPFTPPAAFIPQTLAITQRAADNAPAYDNAHVYTSGDYTNDGSATWIALQATVGNPPPASAGVLGVLLYTRYWALALDPSHIAKAWEVVVTARYKDAFGIEHETLPSASAGMTAAVLSDRPALYSWAAPPDPGFPYKLTGYSVYRGRNGLWGWLDDTDAATTTFKDDGHEPNYGIQPPKGTNPFKVADGVNAENTTKWPGGVTYHEQRRVFFRSDAKPDHFLGSFVGDIGRFDVNDPAQESDAYDWRISSQLLEEIRSARSLGRLVLFTGQSEFSAQGKDGGAISPMNVEVRRHSSHGSSYLDPVEVEHALLFNTAKGNYVRDFFFDYNANAFVGAELTEAARHFFRGRTIVDWAHARVPHHLVWIVRDDGVLLSLTYDRATQTIAWAQHETDGTVESVCSVPEGTEDAVYVIVNRAGGRFIERMASRDYIPDQRFAIFLDSALSFDGRNTGVVTMNVSGATYEGGDQVTVLASAASFAATDVGDRIVIDPDGDSPTPITITAFTDATHVTGTLEAPLPAELQAASTTNWAWARDTLTGLNHLEGQEVTVLADASVQGPFTVVGGAIVLTTPAAIATVGLPYTADAELLDVPQDAVRTNVKGVLRVEVEVVASRGLYAGEDFDNLRPWRQRKVSDAFGPVPLETGRVEVTIGATWNKGGRAVLRQVDPLPLTIVAATREVEVGGR